MGSIDVANTVCYAPYAGGPVSVDQGQVKATSFAPSMLNKGHTIIEPEGPVWVRLTRIYMLDKEFMK